MNTILPWTTTVAHRDTRCDHTRNTVHQVGHHAGRVVVRASVRVLAHLSAWVDVVLVVAVGRRCDLVVCCWVVHKVQVDGRFRPIVQKLCNWSREGGAPVRLLEGGGTAVCGGFSKGEFCASCLPHVASWANTAHRMRFCGSRLAATMGCRSLCRVCPHTLECVRMNNAIRALVHFFKMSAHVARRPHTHLSLS